MYYRILFAILIASSVCYSQKSQNIWWIGVNKGLDFNFRTPKVIGGSKAYFPNAESFNYLPTAVICDLNGKLLYYSDGYHIFDSLHDTVKKISAYTYTVPRLKYGLAFYNPSGNIYYLFSNNGKIDPIDLSKTLFTNTNTWKIEVFNNAHYRITNNKRYLDTLTYKNKPTNNTWNVVIFSGSPYNIKGIYFDSLSSGLENNIIHFRTKATVFEMFSNGLPVPYLNYTLPLKFKIAGNKKDSSIQTTHIKISPNNRLLAIGNELITITKNNNITFYNYLGHVGLHYLNTLSGTIENSMFSDLFPKKYKIKGMEFSADNSKLYVALSENIGGSNLLVQYDVNNGNNLSNYYVVHEYSSNYIFNDMQLAPNGKIYVSYFSTTGIDTGSYLGTIHFPNRVYNNVCFEKFSLDMGSNQNGVYFPHIFKTPPYPEVQDSVAGVASVCPYSTHVPYLFVPDTNYRAYRWHVTGGTIARTSTAGDTVFVHWGATNSQAGVTLYRTHKLGCSDTTFFPVTINPVLRPQTPVGPAEVCLSPAASVYTYQISPNPHSTYTWKVSGGTIVSGQGTEKVNIQFPATGTASIYIAEQSRTDSMVCLGASDTLNVRLHALPSRSPIAAAVDVCQASAVDLRLLQPQPNTYYRWQANGRTVADSSLTQTRFVFESGLPFHLLVTAFTPQGCQAVVTDTTFTPKKVAECLKIPNIFTPNDDGINDFFTIEGIELYPNNVLTLYNRWGTQVAQYNGYRNQWQATNLPDGVYFYALYVPAQNTFFKGWVMVVR